MKNSILKYLLIFLLFTGALIAYLSIFGIETDKFNNQIKNRIIQTNKNLDLELKKIKLILDPLNLKIYAKTVGSTLYFSKRPLELEYIKTQISFRSIIKNQVTSSKIDIATRTILLKDLIKFIRATNNKPELFILEKTIKKGHIILDLSFNIDQNGKIKNDYEIKGLIKNLNINFLNRAKIQDINLNFKIKKDNYLLSDIKFKAEETNFISEKIDIKNRKNNFIVDGIIKNDHSTLNLNILKLLNLNFENVNVENAKFKTNNKFSLEIDKKLNIKNIIINSDININQLSYKKPNILNNYLLDINDFILLKNHKLNLKFKNNNLSIEGQGAVQLKKKLDEIKYSISKKDKNLKVNTELFLNNINLKKQDFLNVYFPDINEKINLKSQKLIIKFINNKLLFSGSGKIKIDKSF